MTGAGAARLTGVGRGEGLRLRVGVSKRTEDGDSGAFWAGAFSAYIYIMVKGLYNKINW